VGDVVFVIFGNGKRLFDQDANPHSVSILR